MSVKTEIHRRDVRELLALREQSGMAAVFDKLEQIRIERGRQVRDQLMADFGTQWHKGNRGAPGMWL